MTPRPNLFLIGSMKCGTSTLHDYLAGHPDIFMSQPKEPCGFVSHKQLRRHWPYMADRGYCDSLERYLALFEGAEGARYVGESSTLYSKLPEITGVASRLHEFAPEARLLYIVRDPIERAISHYWYRVMENGEAREPLAAIAAKGDPRFRALSYYAMQLRPYIELFGRDRIYVETLENLHADPGGTLSLIYSWLGVANDPEHSVERVPSHVTPERLRLERSKLLGQFRESRAWDAMRPFVPRALRRITNYVATKRVQRSAVDTHGVVHYLRPIQRQQAEEFFNLVGVRYDRQWATLYAGEL